MQKSFRATSRTDTPHPEPAQIVTGQFRENAAYGTWREKGTRDWLLIYTMGGRGRFGYEGGEHQVGAATFALIRPGTRHDYGTAHGADKWELLWAHFRPRTSWHEWLQWPEIAPGLMTLVLEDETLRRRAVGRFKEAHRLAIGAQPRRDEFAMNALEEVLLWCDAMNPLKARNTLDPRLRDAMEFACQNLKEKLALEDLARAAGLSASRLAHLFRAQAGITPQQFLETERLRRARQLLDFTSLNVQEVAREVGFENPFYFTTRFKRLTGLNPRDYRQSQRGRRNDE